MILDLAGENIADQLAKLNGIAGTGKALGHLGADLSLKWSGCTVPPGHDLPADIALGTVGIPHRKSVNSYGVYRPAMWACEVVAVTSSPDLDHASTMARDAGALKSC